MLVLRWGESILLPEIDVDMNEVIFKLERVLTGVNSIV